MADDGGSTGIPARTRQASLLRAISVSAYAAMAADAERPAYARVQIPVPVCSTTIRWAISCFPRSRTPRASFPQAVQPSASACSTRAGMCTLQRSIACHWCAQHARWVPPISRARRLPVIRVRRLQHVQLRGQQARSEAYQPGARCHPQCRPDRARAGVACSRPSSRTCWFPGVVDAIRQSKGATLFVCSLGGHAGGDVGPVRRKRARRGAAWTHGMRGLLDYVLGARTRLPLRPEDALPDGLPMRRWG